MANVFHNITQLIGHTPLLRLQGLEEALGLQASLLAKLEGMNPGGSAKDRVALAMLQAAEQSGALKPGGTVIEPTSGNTGIGLAMVAVQKGYAVVIVMPDTMSQERQQLMRAFGATLVLTPGALGMQGAIDEANRLQQTTKNSWVAGQFENPANPNAHFETTGPEIWQDTDGQVDIFVAGVGTGGTITGAGQYLKAQNSKLQIVAVEPADSPVLSGGKAGSHGLQGIGAGFVPAVLNTSVYDQVVTVTTNQAYEACRLLAKTQGVLAGISSGAALWAAISLAKAPEHAGKHIVVLLPDTGQRYLSVGVFDNPA